MKHVYDKLFAGKEYVADDIAISRYMLAKDNVINGGTVIDFGSGRGEVFNFLKQCSKITSVDLAKYYVGFDNVEFIQMDLCSHDYSAMNGRYFDALTCLDCLEHLTAQCIDAVFRMFSSVAGRAIFSIANHSSVHCGVELHLIQEGRSFWDQKMSPYFDIKSYDERYDGNLMMYVCESKR